jgi:hypothetical protein
MATVMGLIGAGGVGQALYDAQQLFFYRQMAGFVLVTWVLVFVADYGSEVLRRRPPQQRDPPEPVGGKGHGQAAVAKPCPMTV